MTIAEKIADRFDDGQKWTLMDGTTLQDVLSKHALPDYKEWGISGEPVRHTFKDGSVITTSGAGWDIGYTHCYCWRGAGHDDTCDGG